MIKSYLDIALPEETAGIAYNIVKQELIAPFADFIGTHRLREHDWSLTGRIQTNGEVIKETVEIAGADKNAILVKGPGITPTKEQTQAMLSSLGDLRKPEELSKLVTGTPNGYMRGHWLVKGNLERYENKGLKALLKTTLPDYSKAGKVDVMFLEGGRQKDAQFFILENDSELRIDFNRQTIRPLEKLSKNSSVYVKITHREEVVRLCKDAIKKEEEIVFMSKYTVRPELDGEKKKIYNDCREEAGLERKEGNQRDIVDAAFAYLLSHPSEKNLTVLVPDPSYGPKISAVLNAVYARGVKKPVSDFSVCRFSAGKSEYGGLNQVVQEDGEYRLYFGSKEVRIPVKKGDMFEEMHFDYKDAVRYVAQVFEHSKEKNYERVVFAFDDADLYDKPVVQAIHEEAYRLKKVEGQDFVIMRPDAAAVMMFTAPLPAGCCYAYDNLWGDIVSDAMDLGASIASINSVIWLSDGRIWPEMGGAGTAPDLVNLFEKEGFWRYNPVPIIEGLAIGFAQASQKESENEKLALYASCLPKAYLNVLKKGMATPDMVASLKAENKMGVDTASFVKAVRVELLTLLGLNKEAEEQQKELLLCLKEIR